MNVEFINIDFIDNGVLVDIHLKDSTQTPPTFSDERYFYKDMNKALTGIRNWFKERLDTEATA